ncbi:MAG: SDR family NAD(P)-dependent oxidoreductase [Candidatus Hodarchaeota archaeon]
MDLSSFYKDKTILVIGGTGSIGKEAVSQLLKLDPKVVRIFSNSENELWKTRQEFIEYEHKVRFLLGDIRDLERLNRAMKDVDYVFNAAAVKHVPLSEYNPLEAVSVNIIGVDNVIQAAFKNNVKKVIQISTDKAINPTTVMGATKMIGERLAISRQLAKGSQQTIISGVRFGNVLGSRGSIIPLIKGQIKKGNKVTLTHPEMKRFFMTMPQAVGLILKAMVYSHGGEVFVLKMPILLIKDLIEIIIEEYGPKIGKKVNEIQVDVIGPRGYEKLDENLISPTEFATCYETDEMYIVYPIPLFTTDSSYMKIERKGTKIITNNNFFYSTENSSPISKEELRKFLKENKLI